MNENVIGKEVVDAAVKVHREPGSGTGPSLPVPNNDPFAGHGNFNPQIVRFGIMRWGDCSYGYVVTPAACCAME
jgi:hypothetical protein